VLIRTTHFPFGIDHTVYLLRCGTAPPTRGEGAKAITAAIEKAIADG